MLTDSEAVFLSRFVMRGWIHAVREDKFEQGAVIKALDLRYLRRELNEAHFTPAGRTALSEGQG